MAVVATQPSVVTMAHEATVTISFRVSAEKADALERLSRSTRVSDILSEYGPCEKPEDLPGDDGLLKRLKKALIERALGAGLTVHLG